MNAIAPVMTRAKLAIALLWCAVSVTAVGDIYVDASASPDEADGTQEHPFATIQAAVDNAKEGDTIRVAAGVYSGGERQVSNKSYARVYISKLKNLKIIGAGRGKSVIVGSRDPAAVGSDDSRDKLVRCMYVHASDGTVIQGFTLKDGETIVGDDTTLGNRNGGGLLADSTQVYLVDCDVLHCCARTGAGIYKGTAVRCRIDECYGLTSIAAREAELFNCIVTRNRSDSNSYGVINQSKVYNCTIVDNDAESAISASANQSGCIVRNSIVALSGEEVKATEGISHDISDCVLESTAERGGLQFVAPIFHDYRLIKNSDAVGAGLAFHLSGCQLPDGIDIDLMKDFNGEKIVHDAEGRINAGAIQAVVTPAGGALVLEKGAYEVNGCTNVAPQGTYLYPESYPTQYCVRVLLNEGEELCRLERYNPTTGKVDPVNYPSTVPQLDGRMWLMPPLSADIAVTNKAIKANTVVWVDKAMGSDSWGEDVTDAGSAAHPYASIQKAVDFGISGNTVINVLPGNYDSGVTTNAEFGSFRLHVEKENVRIVAVNGPAETAISGAPDPVTANAGTLDAGLGTNAVKCAYLHGKNVFLQGFTLSNGYTDGSDSSENFRKGSAVITRAATSTKHEIPFVMDCVISNCHSHLQAVFRAKLFRTRFIDCVTCEGSSASLLNNCLLWGCYGRGCTITSGNTVGYANGNSVVWQSTFVGAIKDGKVCSSGNTSYNSIWDGGSFVASTCIFTNSIAYNAKEYITGIGYRKEDPLFVSREDDGVLRSDSPAVGMGDRLVDCDFAEQFWRIAGGDINGDPLVFTEGKCTVGAFQKTRNLVKVNVPRPQTGGWALSDESAYGELMLYENGDSFDIVPADGNRPCIGVTLAGKNYLFTNHPNETISLDYASFADADGELVVSGIYTTDWYVDDDGDDANTGFLPTRPKKTLATAADLLLGGDTLWVFPGVYDDGKAFHNNDVSASRIVIKRDTSVISMAGAEATIIKGASASSENSGTDEYGNGTDAIRCAYIGSNALLKGFTLTGGRVNTAVTKEAHRNGGAVFGASIDTSSTVSDCIISNNVSVLGTVFKADARNCVIVSNITTDAGCALRKANAYNCHISGNRGKSVISICGNIWATTVAGDNKALDGSEISLVASPEVGSTMYNSLFMGKVSLNEKKEGSYCHMSNCVCAVGSVFNDNAITGKVAVVDFATQQFDESGVIPFAGANAVVDAADESLCPGLYGDVDLRGFQRKMNGRIDIGAYEADWRGVYAATLCSVPNALVVESAAPDTVKDGAVLKISSGSIEAVWRNSTGKNILCEIPVQVTGTGSLTVKLDDEILDTVDASDGEIKLSFVNNIERQRLVFSYSPSQGDEGCALIGGFTRSRLNGFVFSVR